MSLIIVFDTETSGMPDWKSPSEQPHQPHIVEIAGILHNPDGSVIDSYSAIVRPDGWVSDEEALTKHGITLEMAMDVGIPEAKAIEGFMALYDRASIRAAHNATFDDRIMRIGLKRFFSEERAEQFKVTTEKFCTCNQSRAPVGLKKVPTLAEAYKHFFGEELQEAHRAMPDAQACARIYFALQALRNAA